MKNMFRSSHICTVFVIVATLVTIMFPTPPARAGEQAVTTTASGPAPAVVHDIKIFNGEKRLFATYGPSTSVGYPAPLQRKLYRYTGKNATNCPLQIHNYSIGGRNGECRVGSTVSPLQAIPADGKRFAVSVIEIRS